VFKNNLDYIERYNARQNGVTLEMNQFGDLTHEEFTALYLMNTPPREINAKTYVPKGNAPSEIDWNQKGYVTPVKDQGSCGSCWAFSATGSLEPAWKIATGNLVPLSESNLVDCSGPWGNEGCNGGLMTSAFQYIIDNKGIDTAECYPYKPKDQKCQYKTSCIGATVSDMYNITEGSEADLEDCVANKGPVSIAIDASRMSFQFYRSGVYDEKSCSSYNLNHGVTAVGYNNNAAKPYWIVKNSWGKTWGQQGYIWMSKDKKNQCGVATMSTIPIV